MSRSRYEGQMPGHVATSTQPGTAVPSKLRAIARRGAGQLGDEQRQVNFIFRTQKEGKRPDPHVVTIEDVTKGMGIEETDRTRIHDVIKNTRADYGQGSQLRVQRLPHARQRLMSVLRKMETLDSTQRMEIARRAMFWWKKNVVTDMDAKPKVRYVIKKSAALLKSGHHKYIAKKPDGHGGWKYIYDMKSLKREKRDADLAGDNPRQKQVREHEKKLEEHRDEVGSKALDKFKTALNSGGDFSSLTPGDWHHAEEHAERTGDPFHGAVKGLRGVHDKGMKKSKKPFPPKGSTKDPDKDGIPSGLDADPKKAKGKDEDRDAELKGPPPGKAKEAKPNKDEKPEPPPVKSAEHEEYDDGEDENGEKKKGQRIKLHPKVVVELPEDADFHHHITEHAKHLAQHKALKKTDPERAEAHRHAANLHARIGNALHSAGETERDHGRGKGPPAGLMPPENGENGGEGPTGVQADPEGKAGQGGGGVDLSGKPLPQKPDGKRNPPGRDSEVESKQKKMAPAKFAIKKSHGTDPLLSLMLE